MSVFRAFLARGVAPGSHVAILGPTTRQLVTAMQTSRQEGNRLMSAELATLVGLTYVALLALAWVVSALGGTTATSGRALLREVRARLLATREWAEASLNAAADLPPTDGLRYRLADGARVIVRPSGTEPKLKAYLEVVVPVGPEEDGVEAARIQAAGRLDHQVEPVGPAVDEQLRVRGARRDGDPDLLGARPARRAPSPRRRA